MAQALNEEIINLMKQLITQISGCKDGTHEFNSVYKHFITELKKSDTMYFSSKKDIDRNVSSMSEKFCFHGFFKQAEALTNAYKKYISDDLPKSHIANRLNIVKLLLCLSERPITKFLENPEEYEPPKEEVEEEIDWGVYLKEGIERWSPNFDEPSDESEFDSDHIESDEPDSNFTSGDFIAPQISDSYATKTVVRKDFEASRAELLDTIQHTWFSDNKCYMQPQSCWNEANIGILWDEFQKKRIKALAPPRSVSVISEYCVIREVIWQLFGMHSSVVFELVGNNIQPKSGVTISSVTSSTFQKFMKEFIEYIELLEMFRTFQKSVSVKNESVPISYRCYSYGVNEIISPLYKKLSEIEEEVRKQETTYTLLHLAEELKILLEPLKLLRLIHEEVILDFKTYPAITCATTLICKLHNSLPFCLNKLEQDIRLTLLLHSLFYYFHILDQWLTKDNISDFTQEFVIVKNAYNGGNKDTATVASSTLQEETHATDGTGTGTATEIDLGDLEAHIWESTFQLNPELEPNARNNSFLKIICEKVLRIGRNISFLVMLNKYDVIKKSEETIQQEFNRRTIEGLCKFYDLNCKDFFEVNATNADQEDTVSKFEPDNFIYPVFSFDNCSNKPTEDDSLENLIDTSDGFLVAAFQSFFLKSTTETVKREDSSHQTIYELISKITQNLFPKECFFERILTNIIEDRFTISGLFVKNLLVEKYLLEKQFRFLGHIYLFNDDIIFPFYGNLFKKISSSSTDKNWGHHVALTFNLQDTVMDMYPEFYEKCSVTVKDGWNEVKDSLSACKCINIKYKVQWPVNIIIRPEQLSLYREVFQFVLSLKWALYTVSHLSFSDLEDRNVKAIKHVTNRLKVLRFSILNILNTIQHFFFGFALKKILLEFELDFEKANDLNSLIDCHRKFILSVYGTVEDVKLSKKKINFFDLLILVKQLKLMWNNIEFATEAKLRDCFSFYCLFHKAISPTVFPVYNY